MTKQPEFTPRRGSVSSLYKSPEAEEEKPIALTRSRQFRSLLGVVAGCIAWFVVGNLEDRAFYKLRSLATGETVQSRMVEHPANSLVVWGLLVLLCLAGGAIGYFSARR